MSIQEPFYSAMVRVGKMLQDHPDYTVQYDIQIPSQTNVLERLKEISAKLKLENDFRITTPFSVVGQDGNLQSKSNPPLHITINPLHIPTLQREAEHYTTSLSPEQCGLMHYAFIVPIKNHKEIIQVVGTIDGGTESDTMQRQKRFCHVTAALS